MRKYSSDEIVEAKKGLERVRGEDGELDRGCRKVRAAVKELAKESEGVYGILCVNWDAMCRMRRVLVMALGEVRKELM